VDPEDQSPVQPESERRQHRRVRLATQIQCEAVGGNEILVTRDVSVAGMFIMARMPIPVDSELSVTFRLYSRQPPISCRAQVVHSLPGVGVGIKFLSLDEEAVRSLEKFVGEGS
jgi:hypothetical protein